MIFPNELKYTKTHEWIRDLGNGVFEIGITDHAQHELGDIVYINLPSAGDDLKAGSSFADIESVKAVSEIISPVNGTVKEINEKLGSSPELINKAPYEAWFIRAEGSLAGEFITASEYQASIKE